MTHGAFEAARHSPAGLETGPEQKKREKQMKRDQEQFATIESGYPWIWGVLREWKHDRKIQAWVPVVIYGRLGEVDVHNLFHCWLMTLSQPKDVEFWLYQHSDECSKLSPIDIRDHDSNLAATINRELLSKVQRICLAVVDFDKTGHRRLSIFDPVRRGCPIDKVLWLITETAASQGVN